MADEFLDSFDDRATVDLGAKYAIFTELDTGANNVTLAITSAAGRNGTNGLRMTRGATTTGSQGFEAFVTIPAASRRKLAVARRWSTLPPAGQYRSILAVRDSGTTQVEVRLYGDGSLRLFRAGSQVTGGQSVAGVIAANLYYHLEWDITVHNTTGASELRINESTVAFLVTNQNTRVSANNSMNELGLLEIHNASTDVSYTADLDDVVFHDQVAFIGDIRVGNRLVQTNGTYTTWISNGAPTLAECVDEATQDGDTTYISSATVGQKATFQVEDIPVSAVIKFVQQNFVAKKTDAGTRTFAPRIKSGATEVLGTDLSPGTTYTYLRQMANTDPATGIAWTPTGFNSAEFGVEVTS